MNPGDIPEAGSGWQILADVGPWLGPVVYLIGLAIALWAYRRCRKCGYLVIAIYFAVVAVWPFIRVPIWRAFHANNPPNISEQTEQKIEAAQRDAADKVLAEAGHPPIYARKNIHIPVGAAALVIGVWLLARREAPVS